jgi:hypothetical protein
MSQSISVSDRPRCNRHILAMSPEPSFSYTGLELFEVWSVMQWLNIIFVFHLIGYRGQMVDFRRRTGRRGETVAVPLPAPE